jgi:hypothetical protein
MNYCPSHSDEFDSNCARNSLLPVGCRLVALVLDLVGRGTVLQVTI